MGDFTVLICDDHGACQQSLERGAVQHDAEVLTERGPEPGAGGDIVNALGAAEATQRHRQIMGGADDSGVVHLRGELIEAAHRLRADAGVHRREDVEHDALAGEVLVGELSEISADEGEIRKAVAHLGQVAGGLDGFILKVGGCHALNRMRESTGVPRQVWRGRYNIAESRPVLGKTRGPREAVHRYGRQGNDTLSTNKERGEQALNQLEKELRSRDRKEKTGPLKTVVAAAAAIVVVVGGIWFAASQTGDDEEVVAEETTAESTPETPEFEPLAMERSEPLPETVSCTYEEAGEAANDATPPEQTEDISTTGTVTVDLSTNQGPIGMELDRSVAPCTVNAIEHLVDTGYYDNTECHRLTTSGIFVLQCGDPTGTGAGGPGFQFANEYPTDETEDSNPVIYPRGSLAMANSGPDTNGSQFFLNYDDSPLAPDYTYFGQISEEGLATLDSIAETGVEGGAGDGAPAEEVLIEDAELV